MRYKDIGYRIQIAREEAGLNQKALARKLGISQSTLSNYEKGKRRLYLAQLQQIADILGRPIEYFLQPIENHSLIAPADSHDDKGRELLNIVDELAQLSPEDQKSALDFIRWLKYRKESIFK